MALGIGAAAVAALNDDAARVIFHIQKRQMNLAAPGLKGHLGQVTPARGQHVAVRVPAVPGYAVKSVNAGVANGHNAVIYGFIAAVSLLFLIAPQVNFELITADVLGVKGKGAALAHVTEAFLEACEFKTAHGAAGVWLLGHPQGFQQLGIRCVEEDAVIDVQAVVRNNG